MKKSIGCLLSLIFLIVCFNQALAEENNDIKGRYTIGPNDILEISVWKDETLNRKIVVPPDRVISYPLIGDIDITNMTVTQLRVKLITLLSEFIPEANVAVLLEEVRNLKTYVIGKVNNPGVFPIDLETNIMQVLSMAGGFTQFASSHKIMIIRTEGDRVIKIPFNFKEVEKGNKLDQIIFLRRGDVIVVP